jgi:hypothetical protein
VLLPGTRLGEAMADPENPSWRRPRPGRPTSESNSLSLPFDDKGQSGFVARGYHAEPDVQNQRGNTGATFACARGSSLRIPFCAAAASATRAIPR